MATGPASSLLPLFIDTNLDTHLALAILPEDTVDDLKGKIRTEHALCFPKVGEIFIEALKVKRRGCLYHLADSMPLWRVFNGTKGNHFLHADLVPATSIVTSQTQTARVETNHQLEAHSQLRTICNSTLLAVSGEDRNQDSVANGGPIGKGLSQTSIVNHLARRTLPDALLQKPSAGGDSLSHNVSSPQKRNLDVSSHENHRQINADARDDEQARDSLSKNATPGIRDDEENHEKGLVNNHGDLRKESGATNLIEKSADKLLGRSSTEAGGTDPSSTNPKQSGYATEFKSVTSTDFPVQDVNNGNSGGLFSKGLTIESNPSEVFPSNLVLDDSPLQNIPTGVRVKKKKKTHLLKDDEAPQGEQARNSLSKTNATPGIQDAEENQEIGLVNDHDLRKDSDATNVIESSADKLLDRSSTEVDGVYPSSTNRKPSDHATELNSVTSTDFPVEDIHKDNSGGLLPGNSKGLSVESNAGDIRKEAVQNGDHAAVDPGVPSNSRRSRKKSKTEKIAASTQDAHYSVKPLNEDDIDEAFRNSHAKLSEASTVAMTNADQANAIPTKSEAPSEIGGKNSHCSKKKKRQRTEMLNSQFNSPDIVNSPREQVSEDIQNKKSSAHQQPLDKESKGVPVPLDAAAAGNSGLVTSTFLSSPNGKKKKHSQKKSEKIEQDSNLYSTTHETVNSSREQGTEEFLKEKSIGPLEYPSKDPMEAAVIGKAFENSTIIHSQGHSNPNDKKSKRRKKSEKIESHSGRSIRPESVYSLGDSVTQQNPKESLEGNQNEKSGSHLGYQGEKSEGASLLAEAEIVTNPATGDSTVSLNPSDKKSKLSRKKSGKSELPGNEASKNEDLHSLVKGTIKEDVGMMLNGGSAGMGGNPKSETILKTGAALESTTELDSAPTSAGGGRNSCHEEKTKARKGLIDHSTNCDLDPSSATRHAPENLKNVLRNTTKTSGSMDCAKPPNPDLMGSDNSSEKHGTGHLSAENANEDNTIKSGMAREETDMEAIHDKSHTMPIESIEAKDRGQLGDSDKVQFDFSKLFGPIKSQLEPARGPSSVETESKKGDREKTKRKKKLNPSPQNSSLPISEEQCVLKNKSQDNDSGKHSLDGTGVQIPKEITSIKKHVEKVAKRTHSSDLDFRDASTVMVSPRKPRDYDRPGKKIKESNAHVQVSLSVDEQNKHPNRTSSLSTGCQSLAHNEHNDATVSADAVPHHKNLDSSLNKSPGGVPLTQNSGHTVTNITPEEDLGDLVASSDSTEEDTPVLRKRFRVAVRKVPRGKVQDKLKEEKASLLPSATIFNDSISESEVDEFEISNRHTPTKAISDNSSTSDDSDADIEESQISYKNSPGAEATDYRKSKSYKGTSDAKSSLTKSSNVKRKGKPLSVILKNTSSYKKAKLTASQSQFEDSEGPDVIPETQPEPAFI